MSPPRNMEATGRAAGSEGAPHAHASTSSSHGCLSSISKSEHLGWFRERLTSHSLTHPVEDDDSADPTPGSKARSPGPPAGGVAASVDRHRRRPRRSRHLRRGGPGPPRRGTGLQLPRPLPARSRDRRARTALLHRLVERARELSRPPRRRHLGPGHRRRQAPLHGRRYPRRQLHRLPRQRLRGGCPAGGGRHHVGRARGREQRARRLQPVRFRDPHGGGRPGRHRAGAGAPPGPGAAPRRRARRPARDHGGPRRRPRARPGAQDGTQPRGRAARGHRRRGGPVRRGRRRAGGPGQRQHRQGLDGHTPEDRRRRHGSRGPHPRAAHHPILPRMDRAVGQVRRHQREFGDGRAAVDRRAAGGRHRGVALGPQPDLQRRGSASAQPVRAASGDRDRECAALHQCAAPAGVLRVPGAREPGRHRGAGPARLYYVVQPGLRKAVRVRRRRGAGPRAGPPHHH